MPSPISLPYSRSGRSALEVAGEAALQAGELLVQRFHGQKQVTYKGRGNIVTDVDVEAQDKIVSLLREEFPDFGVLAEESAAIEGSAEYLWVVDPLDGSRNYASGVPFFCTSLALARGGQVVLGLTYDPMRRELFQAVVGTGATLNDAPLQVSQQDALWKCVVGLDMGYHNDRARHALELILALWPGMQSVRIMGSSALGLAYAAAGRIDLYFHQTLAPWDLAAGLLLVQEAGGMVADRQGRPATFYTEQAVVSNPALLEEFLAAARGSRWLA